MIDKCKLEVNQMQFVAKLRKQTDSMVITIPHEVITAMKLNEGKICQFSINKNGETNE